MRIRVYGTFVALLVALCGTSQAAKPSSTTKTITKPPTHPVVPAFERFNGDMSSPNGVGDDIQLGQLLLGELNCASCHELNASTRAAILPKQAPILDDVGDRVKPEWLREVLNSPRHAKPGTTMPNMLGSLKPEERTKQVEALVHFLVATGSRPPVDQAPDKTAIEHGETLFHEAGCVACHGARTKDAVALNTSVPLGDPATKYSIASLAKFLRDPMTVRPSGRMPNLNLTDQEGYDLAHYFLRDVSGTPPNLNYAYFEGDFKNVGDFATKGSKSTGTCLGFDLGVARKKEQFALRFTGFLRIPKDGEYTVYATSDDGCRVKIDGARIIENQVIHARSTKSAEVTLEAGMHELTVDYFNNTGEAVLDIEIEGPDTPRGDITKLMSLTEGVMPAPTKEPFQVDEKLVADGRRVFGTTGCASCHELRGEGSKKPIASALKAPKAADMDLEKGCLSERPKGKAANFGLTARQREVIRAALNAKPQAKDDAQKNSDVIVKHLTTFNCVACHARDGVGGVETARDDYFLTTIKEMGDEGRVPPPLNGVGGKINMSWMRNIVDKGVKSRPYMLTRMPAFGIRNVKPLIETFETVDVLPPKKLPKFEEPAYRVKDQGRLLVGSKGFSCIKCHTFDKFKAEGIQSIDMTTMTKRLRPEWFVRYVRDPMTFRPGTRMPSAWPKEGKSYLPSVFEGDSDKQIAAVWTYLEGGAKAPPPIGVGGDPIELIATTEPVIYRNFIEGAGPRAIGIGYPEKVNLAFDAAELRLATIWKGPFIDAHVHWSSRGGGLAPPMGDHVIPQATAAAFAELKSADAAWPTDSARKRGGYQFLGYRLDKSGRPTFEYRIADVHIDDKPEPVSAGANPQLRRTFTFEAAKPPKNLWLRIAAAPKIEEAGDGWYVVDGSWKVRLDGATPIVREADKVKELLVSVVFDGKKAKIVETFDW